MPPGSCRCPRANSRVDALRPPITPVGRHDRRNAAGQGNRGPSGVRRVEAAKRLVTSMLPRHGVASEVRPRTPAASCCPVVDLEAVHQAGSILCCRPAAARRQPGSPSCWPGSSRPACSSAAPATTRRGSPSRRACWRPWAAFVLWALVVAAGRRRVPGRRVHPDRVHRPRRRAPADLPVPAGQLPGRPAARQPGDRAELRLVGRQAQPPPRPPQPRGQGPGHRDRRAGLHRRPGAAPRGVVPRFIARHQAYLFFPLLLLEALQPARRQHPGARPTRLRTAPGETALLAVHVVGYLTARVPGAVAGARRWCSSSSSRRCSASTWAARSRPTTRACRSLDRATTESTSCAGRCSRPATSAAAGSSTSRWAG